MPNIVQIMKLLIMQFYPASCHFIPARYEHILHSFQLSDTSSHCSVPNVREQESHRTKQQVNCIVAYFVAYFLHSKRVGKNTRI
jgi:hypothetical protein